VTSRAARTLVTATAGLAGLPALAAAGERVTLTWGGYVTLGSSYGQPPRAGWPQLAPIAPILRASDLAVLNYEGTFAPGGPSKCGVPHRDRSERAAALMRRLSHSDFGGRMRFTRLGTAGYDRGRLRRAIKRPAPSGGSGSR
jgi:hypothetical protein